MARKLQKFIILFDNPNLLYFPGHFISGRVIVELEEDTSVLGVYFHVVGEGVVRVVDRRQQAFNDKENYIDFRMRLLGEPGERGGEGDVNTGTAEGEEVAATLIGSREDERYPMEPQDEQGPRGTSPILLSPGIHSFPFKLGLPLGLPSTFLGKHGWVQYFCKAALREPNGLTHKNQQVFIVMSPIDLNLEPSILAQPFHCEIEHKLGMTCLSQGPVSCRVRLDRGGYVPGETISIWARVHNQSKVTIKKTRACLTETIQYISKAKVMQTETRELSSVSRGKVKPTDTDDWKYEQLYVPPLPPTNLRGCHLIRIQYDVFFIIEPNNLEKEIKLQLPIMMATYPYRNTDGTLKKKRGAQYPNSLPIFRPWLNEKSFE